MHYLTQIYNASFKRLPDPDGLRYWIGNFSSGKDDERAVASSFFPEIKLLIQYLNPSGSGRHLNEALYI